MAGEEVVHVWLTPREREIAGLVASGLTNREIAARLFIGVRTAEYHVEQLRHKLGARTRSQVAAWWVDQLGGAAADGNWRLLDAGAQPAERGSAASSNRASGATAPPNNLPVRATAFIGRQRELADIGRLLSRTRLLTLTGAAGVGKTRLALEVAAVALDEYPDGAWFVDLGPIGEPAHVLRAVAATLSVRERHGQPLLQTLVNALHGRRLLLVLDNCEHLIDTCAHLADSILRRGPGPTLLATSRENLRVEGEIRWPIQPLTVPPAGLATKPDQLLAWDSVALFCDRALQVEPNHQLAQENAPAITEICRRLDGIPLAIELAATRLGMMSPEQILARLDDRFALLTRGSRTAIARQQTLQAALDWSYGLLTDAERKLFRRLSVFTGGWTLDAAEAVASGTGDSLTVLDLLSSLADKSMVVCLQDASGHLRYDMLETLRRYARDRLAESTETDAAQQAHLRYFLALAEEAAPRLLDRSPEAMEGVEREAANLRAAMAFAGTIDINRCLRMAVALEQYWVTRGRYTEGQEALTEVAIADATEPALRSRALAELARQSFHVGDADGVARHAKHAVWAGRQAGPCIGLSRGLGMAGVHAMWRGEPGPARALFAESVWMAAAAGEPHFGWIGRMGLVLLAFEGGDLRKGRRLGEALLAGWNEDYDLYAHCLTRQRLADAECRAGDLEAAASHLMIALPLAARFGFDGTGSDLIRVCSQVEAARGHEDRRWRLVGAAMSLRGHRGVSILSTRQGEVWPPEPDPSTIAAEEAALLVAEGDALSPHETYEYALAGLTEPD